jgi:protein-tyrosine phosphatase
MTDTNPSGNSEPWPHDEILHAWWVEPGRLLAGEYPGDTTPEKAAVKLRLLVDAGASSIVDLTTTRDHIAPYDEELRTVAENAGKTVRHFLHPIPDMHVVEQEEYDRILARIQEEMDSGRIVYVHCWGGKGRTCTVIGCLLVDAGLDYKSAVARLAELRAGTRKARFTCPESESQHEAIRSRESRRQLSRSALPDDSD